MLAKGTLQRRGAARPPRGVLFTALALLCLLSSLAGPTPALCLELEHGCQEAPRAESCHGEEKGGAPSCGSCVDVLVPDDAFTARMRAERELRAPAAQLLTPAAAPGLPVAVPPIPAAACTAARAPLHPSVRTAVLRV